MTAITARAFREGRWWCVEVPINGDLCATQGRSLAEAQFMAEDLVAMWAEELDDPELAAATVTLRVEGAEQEAAEAVRAAQAEAEAAREHARRTQIEAVASMRARGLTMQDIAQILGVTKARVSQLAHA